MGRRSAGAHEVALLHECILQSSHWGAFHASDILIRPAIQQIGPLWPSCRHEVHCVFRKYTIIIAESTYSVYFNTYLGEVLIEPDGQYRCWRLSTAWVAVDPSGSGEVAMTLSSSTLSAKVVYRVSICG
jgi:hypothetical protein